VQRVRAHLADGGAGLRSMAGCAARTPTPDALCPCLAAPGRRLRRSDSCAGGESSRRSSRASSIHAIRSSTGCDPRSASRRPTARRSPSRFRTSSQCFATRLVLAFVTDRTSPAYGEYPNQAGFAAHSLVAEVRACSAGQGLRSPANEQCGSGGGTGAPAPCPTRASEISGPREADASRARLRVQALPSATRRNATRQDSTRAACAVV
jgi:hypothetical protein